MMMMNNNNIGTDDDNDNDNGHDANEMIVIMAMIMMMTTVLMLMLIIICGVWEALPPTHPAGNQIHTHVHSSLPMQTKASLFWFLRSCCKWSSDNS